MRLRDKTFIGLSRITALSAILCLVTYLLSLFSELDILISTGFFCLSIIGACLMVLIGISGLN